MTLPITYVERRATLTPLIAGVPIGHVVSADWSGSFGQPYNEGHIVVTQLPEGFDNDQPMQIVAGNGLIHTTRFQGFSRSPIFNLDGTITIQGVGQYALVYEYENSEDPSFIGGLDIANLLSIAPQDGDGNLIIPTGTDQQIVVAALNKVPGISFSASNIGGTGVTFGSNIASGLVGPFLWSAGTAQFRFAQLNEQGKGESCAAYINRWDNISAVHPGPFIEFSIDADGNFNGFAANSPGSVTSPVGFYRTFETMAGVIYRSLLGSRPRGSPTILIPFTEGVDLRTGIITRGRPQANRFQAIGYTPPGQEPEHFVMQSSNPYMGNNKITAPPIQSEMIEKSANAQPGNGMSCERVCYAMEPDQNRIIVSGFITTGRDDYISHGATILVQGGLGGQVGHLGTAENVWVQSVRGSVSIDGFVQELEVLGGGVPDNFLPGVPQ